MFAVCSNEVDAVEAIAKETVVWVVVCAGKAGYENDSLLEVLIAVENEALEPSDETAVDDPSSSNTV